MSSCKELTVVLPCAGDGVRMNLSYPKELFEIFPGVKLIDFSLDHIKYFADRSGVSVKVAVVIKCGKEDVFSYVKSKLSGMIVDSVTFNNKFREWPGSVFSAYERFSENNIVLLPDSFISMGENNRFTDDEGMGIIEHSLNVLERMSVVFGIKSCSEKNILKDLGALRTKGEKIDVFIDKPVDTEGLNGFWCSYGFRREIANDLYKFLIKNVEKERVEIKDQKFFPPGYFNVYEYFDLGTSESVEHFRSNIDPD